MNVMQMPPARNPTPAPAKLNRLRVIGLAGRAGAGKDTCADILCAHEGFWRTAFADPLRAEIMNSFGMDPCFFSRDLKERRTPSLAIARSDDPQFIQRMVALGEDIHKPRSPREIMRWWGTEYRRHQDKRYWTERMIETIDQVIRTGAHHHIVITDVRFLNEAQCIQSMGGEIWMVQRGIADKQPASHQSEYELSRIQPTTIIDNNGSLADLADAIENLLWSEATMRKRSKHYSPKRVEIPMLVKAYKTFAPLDMIIDQIAADGTVTCSMRGIPMYRDLEDGQWYDTAAALAGVIDHLEMYQLRHQVRLPIEALKEFHKSLEFAMPVSAGLLARLQRDVPKLQTIISRCDPEEMVDILRQVQIKELLDTAQ